MEQNQSFIVTWFCTLNILAYILLMGIRKFLQDKPIIHQDILNLLHRDIAVLLIFYATITNIAMSGYVLECFGKDSSILLGAIYFLVFIQTFAMSMLILASCMKLRAVYLYSQGDVDPDEIIDDEPDEEESRLHQLRLFAALIAVITVSQTAYHGGPPEVYYNLILKPPVKSSVYIIVQLSFIAFISVIHFIIYLKLKQIDKRAQQHEAPQINNASEDKDTVIPAISFVIVAGIVLVFLLWIYLIQTKKSFSMKSMALIRMSFGVILPCVIFPFIVVYLSPKMRQYFRKKMENFTNIMYYFIKNVLKCKCKTHRVYPIVPKV